MNDHQELTAAIKEAAVETDGRITLPCAKAFMLAERFQTPPGVIGEICNNEHIKIVRCQLGCFR